MTLRKNCPCDIDGICPYDAEYMNTCEYYCSQEDPEDDPDIWNEDSIQLYDGGFEDE